jgi:hypothetical protein
VIRAADPPRSLISFFYTEVATFLSSRSSFYAHEGEWTPFQTHSCSENLAAPGIEPGSSATVARNCDNQTTEAVKRLFR